MIKTIKKLISSTLKVTASENLNVQDDLDRPDGEKSIAELLNEQEKNENNQNTSEN